MFVSPISFSMFSPVKMQKTEEMRQSNPIKNIGLQKDTFVRSLSQIPFTSVDDGPDGDVIRSLGRTTCPCCGIKMFSGKELVKVTPQNMSGPSSTAIAILKDFEECMHPTEKKVFKFLEKLSEKEPQKDLRQLLDKVRPAYYEKQREAITQVLDDMSEIGQDLDSKSKSRLKVVLKEEMDIISSDSNQIDFKRKKFIDKVKDVTWKFPQREIADKLLKKAEEVPTSSDGVSAFIVKYTQKNPNTKRERTAYDIAYRLIQPGQGTIEHIHPRSDGGRNRVSNYLWECAQDNNNRGSQPFSEFVKSHPGMAEKNIQQHIDEVIEIINNGGMEGFRAYPLEVAETIKKETKGKVILDTSKLNITKEEAAAEIAEREKRYAKEPAPDTQEFKDMQAKRKKEKKKKRMGNNGGVQENTKKPEIKEEKLRNEKSNKSVA